MNKPLAIISIIGVCIAGAMISTMGLAGLSFPPGPSIVRRAMPNSTPITLTFLIAGANEVIGTPITVAGMLGTDVLCAVIVLTTAAAIASAAQRALADFRCQDGAMQVVANNVNNTNNQYLIIVSRNLP